MIIFVGSPQSPIVEDRAREKDPCALLVTQNNISTVYDTTVSNTAYTSIIEFWDKDVFLNLLVSAEEVVYCPDTFIPEKFNLENPLTGLRAFTEYHLLLAQQQGANISNLEFLGQEQTARESQTLLSLIDYRRSDSAQLWTAGCSYTHGVGVDVSQRFTNLLAKQLNMPASCLAEPGSSISWANDQLLRSDIRAGDVVVWAITERSRLTKVYDHRVTHVSVGKIELYDGIERQFLTQSLLDEQTVRYQQLTKINQVVNFCDKVGAHLVLLGVLTDPTDLLYLQDNPYFYQCQGKFIDLGTDKEHPGPKHHQYYADTVIEILKRRGVI